LDILGADSRIDYMQKADLDRYVAARRKGASQASCRRKNGLESRSTAKQVRKMAGATGALYNG